MKSVNVHEAKTQFSGMLAEIEATRTSFVICRNGEPVADLVPHRKIVSMAGDPKLGAITLHYDPTEGVGEEDWPSEFR